MTKKIFMVVMMVLIGTISCFSKSEQVINLVNQSSISEESKSIIKTGLAVAFASAHLWNPDVIEGEIEEEEIEE